MRIILGTDGSEGARWAAETLVALPLASPAEVTVLAAVDVPEPSFTSVTPMARRAYSQALATMRREAEEEALHALDTTGQILDGHSASITTRLMHGPAETAIIEMAERLRADLVVVGSRGLGPVKEFLLGNVSQQVIRSAPCSVLIARGPVGPVRRVLIGMDGSVHAEAATRFVSDLPLPSDASVRLCAVAEAPTFGPGKVATPQELAAALRTIAEVGRASADRVLAEGRRLLAAVGCEITTSMRAGHPVDHLLAAIREFRPDLAVIGAKGRTGAKSFALGSVAQMVLKYASCSVLVVRP
ncbi:MAG: universal stress protein [candidate division NC10 bacterium]|nr:universal stress protein [candidate division NC10 bacterium]